MPNLLLDESTTIYIGDLQIECKWSAWYDKDHGSDDYPGSCEFNRYDNAVQCTVKGKTQQWAEENITEDLLYHAGHDEWHTFQHHMQFEVWGELQ